MQTALNEAAKWLNDNRMVINPNKSNYIIIGHPKKTCQNSFNLHINNNPLTPCTNAKLLGIIIDDQLCWKNHVEFLLRKTAPKLGLLRRLRFNLPSDLLQNLYMAIIQPFIDYCISVWGSCNKTHKQLIQKIQNRAVRIVSGNYDFSVRSSTLIEKMGWMNIEERHKYFTLILMYKCSNNLTSDTISNLFCKPVSVHHSTRFASADNLF